MARRTASANPIRADGAGGTAGRLAPAVAGSGAASSTAPTHRPTNGHAHRLLLLQDSPTDRGAARTRVVHQRLKTIRNSTLGLLASGAHAVVAGEIRRSGQGQARAGGSGRWSGPRGEYLRRAAGRRLLCRHRQGARYAGIQQGLRIGAQLGRRARRAMPRRLQLAQEVVMAERRADEQKRRKAPAEPAPGTDSDDLPILSAI